MQILRSHLFPRMIDEVLLGLISLSLLGISFVDPAARVREVSLDY